jgi:hypothetical protein
MTPATVNKRDAVARRIEAPVQPDDSMHAFDTENPI